MEPDLPTEPARDHPAAAAVRGAEAGPAGLAADPAGRGDRRTRGRGPGFAGRRVRGDAGLAARLAAAAAVHRGAGLPADGGGLADLDRAADAGRAGALRTPHRPLSRL